MVCWAYFPAAAKSPPARTSRAQRKKRRRPRPVLACRESSFGAAGSGRAGADGAAGRGAGVKLRVAVLRVRGGLGREGSDIVRSGQLRVGFMAGRQVGSSDGKGRSGSGPSATSCGCFPVLFTRALRTGTADLS